MPRILPVIFNDAVFGCVGEKLRDALLALAGEVCNLRGGFGLAKPHLQHDLRNLVIGACTIQNNVFRITLCQLFDAEFVRKPVRNHFAQFKQDFSCHMLLLIN